MQVVVEVVEVLGEMVDLVVEEQVALSTIQEDPFLQALHILFLLVQEVVDRYLTIIMV